MNNEGYDSINRQQTTIPKIKAESETQTTGHLITLTPEEKISRKMEEEKQSQQQNMSIKKRRNLSKNRGQAARQREKTPEPGRFPGSYEDTTTSDDEDIRPNRTSREIEADNTYEEMKRLVSQKANFKDPIYDLDIDEVKEARAAAANERRRRSISPFAILGKEDGGITTTTLERKGSFIDPGNKLLSTTYTLSPKEEDTHRRNSLTIEPSRERKSSLTPPPMSVSPKDNSAFTYPPITTPKKQEEIIYADELSRKRQDDITKDKPLTPIKKDRVDEFSFDKKEEKSTKHAAKPQTPKSPEHETGELVTKVIQIERTPSRKLTQENKPNVEIRQRVVRTPSKKTTPDAKPTIAKQPVKPAREEPQSKVPPEKPARSKSATRFGGKTSESEMSEDQGKQQNNVSITAPKRKVAPTPRRFLRNRSPRGNRSQSATRVETLPDKTSTGMSQTSKEIIELMQLARTRSLSIPKDDPKLPKEYKNTHNRNLMTPNKIPSTPRRSSRGVSCPKTIQIISDKEILAGLSSIQRLDLEFEKRRPKSSGYIDASQSEYTSSCYSSTPSENECDFDLSEKTAELTRKLHILSQQVNTREANIILSNEITEINLKPVLRKRSLIKSEINNGVKNEETIKEKRVSTNVIEKKKMKKSEWKIFGLRDCWRQFKQERMVELESIRLLRNRCICDLLILIIMCGLGGMMFKTLEGSFENAYKCSTRNVKRDFIESLWRGSNYMREEEWKSMARKKLFEFEDQLHTAHEAGVTSYSGQRSWNFMNSFVYCLTLITTIGYGHIAPKTISGRVATIVYAIIGIPLFLIVLADFGKLFTRIIKFFWSFIRRFYYTRSCRKVRRTTGVQEVMKGLNIVYDVVRRPSQIFVEDEEDNASVQMPPLQRKPSADIPPPLPPKPGATTNKDLEADIELDTPAPSIYEIDDEFNLPISVAIVILIIYILIGAVAYNFWETWSFFESFYFVFISMSTIGLGDLVPDHPMFMMGSILYLVFGLALTSMCINVVQLKLSNTFKQASAKLGATIGLKVAEEDGSLVPITPPPSEIVPVHKPIGFKADEKERENKKVKEENDKPIAEDEENAKDK